MQNQPFTENGFFIHRFEKLGMLEKIREDCEYLCKTRFGEKFTALGHYHHIDVSQQDHDAFQYELYSHLNQQKYHHQFVTDNLSFFTSLLGPDIDIQANTYLRISRPGTETDNIGIHRDTDYGNSAFELSLSLPLISQEAGAGLNVIPGSHLKTSHDVEQVKRKDVDKGTDKNEMGFLYAPKIPVSLNKNELKCISLAFGQGLGFSLGLMHGQIVNSSSMTRWSIDFRLKNSFHPVTKNLKDGYYVNFKKGDLTNIGSAYYAVNPDEVCDLK